MRDEITVELKQGIGDNFGRMNVFWKRDDVLQQFTYQIDADGLSKSRKQSHSQLDRACWKNLREAMASLPLEGKFEPEVSQGVVKIGSPEVLSSEQKRALRISLKELIPWRKGPFEVMGEFIDSEWQSSMKWDRLSPALGQLKGKRIADIGCGNGYYMFRLLDYEPGLVLGIDPSEKFYYAFELLQRFAKCSKLQFELMGIQELPIFPELFDVVLCMGVFYHQRSPLDAIRALQSCIRLGGTLFLETLYYPGETSFAFYPQGRYSKMQNVHFIPTKSCLANMLTRNGFTNIEIISESVTSFVEQRSTPYMPFESLRDFLDPLDSSKTVEGYPSPRRVIIKAYRK